MDQRAPKAPPIAISSWCSCEGTGGGSSRVGTWDTSRRPALGFAAAMRHVTLKVMLLFGDSLGLRNLGRCWARQH
jgi:hypothetical protein